MTRTLRIWVAGRRNTRVGSILFYRNQVPSCGEHETGMSCIDRPIRPHGFLQTGDGQSFRVQVSGTARRCGGFKAATPRRDIDDVLETNCAEGRSVMLTPNVRHYRYSEHHKRPGRMQMHNLVLAFAMVLVIIVVIIVYSILQ